MNGDDHGKDDRMSVRSVLLIKSAPEGGDEMEERLIDGLAVQAADPGCLGVVLHRSVERPDEYLIEFTWASEEAHLSWRDQHRDEWRERVGFDQTGAESEPLGHYELASTVK